MNNDVLDDILGDIDDNEIDRAIETITAHAAELNASAISKITKAAAVAEPTNPGITAKIKAVLPKPAARKTTPAKKKEFAPKLTAAGALDHSGCGHDRTPKGRAACRAEYAKKN